MSKDTLIKVGDVIYFLFNFIVAILLIITFCKLSSSEYKYMASVGNSWNKGPISFIDQSSDYCIANSRVIVNNWPGTTDGCYCNPNFDLFYGPIRPGYCRRKRDNFLTCNTIPAKPAMPYEKWRGKSICAVRVQASYLDLTIANNEKACPSSMRSCGIIDTLNNVICVPSLTPCPINKITVASAIPSDMNYTNIPTTTGSNIYTSNENTIGEVLIDLFISDLQPCADPGNVDYINTPYILNPYYYNKFNCNDGVGSFKYDNRYTLVDTYNQQRIMQDNNISPVVATLPLYDYSNDNHATNLYSKNYIGVNPSCLNEIKAQDSAKSLLTDLTAVDANITSAYNLCLWSMILATTVVALVILHIVLWFLSKKKIFRSMMILTSILMLVVCILCSILTAYLKNYSSYHSFFLDSGCVDGMTLSAAQNFYPNINSSKVMALASAVISSLVLAFSIFRIVAPSRE